MPPGRRNEYGFAGRSKSCAQSFIFFVRDNRAKHNYYCISKKQIQARWETPPDSKKQQIPV
jgi:hypothetical protein